MINTKIKTVTMNERGVIVIPEEMREDLGLEGKTNLVLIESNDQIVLRKESEVVKLINSNEDDLWKRISVESLKRAWEKEDSIWDEFAKKSK